MDDLQPAPVTQQITIAPPPPGPEAPAPSPPSVPASHPSVTASAELEQISAVLVELTATLTALAQQQAQTVAITKLQGERLDQLASLLEERDRHAEVVLNGMLQATDELRGISEAQAQAREELGIASAALIQVTMDLRTMYELEAAEEAEENEDEEE